MNQIIKIPNEGIQSLIELSKDEEQSSKYVLETKNKMIVMTNDYLKSTRTALYKTGPTLKNRQLSTLFMELQTQIIDIQEANEELLVSYIIIIKQCDEQFNINLHNYHKMYIYLMIKKNFYQTLYQCVSHIMAAIGLQPKSYYNKQQLVSTLDDTNSLFTARKWKMRLKKKLKVWYTINSEIHFLSQNFWMLENKTELSIQQHIKNVTNPCYIPPKNCIVPLLKGKCQLNIISWNINIKVNNNTNKEKQLLIAQLINTIKPQIVFFQECHIQVKLSGNYSFYLQKYNHQSMINCLAQYNMQFLRANFNPEKSGGLATYIDSSIDQREITSIFVPTLNFCQVFELKQTIDGLDQVCFLANSYVFPDKPRKDIVQLEIHRFVSQLNQKYGNCSILLAADFNESIWNEDDPPLSLNLPTARHLKVNTFNLQLPNKLDLVTHNRDCIDYFLQQNFNITQHYLLNHIRDHYGVYIQIEIQFSLFERTQQITSNKRINKIIKPQWPLRSTTYLQMKQFQSYLIKKLTSKQKLEKTIDPYSQFLEEVKSDGILQVYYDKFTKVVQQLNAMTNPTTFHKLAQRLFTLMNKSPVAKQVINIENGLVLSEFDTEQLIYEQYNTLYSMNLPKQMQTCSAPFMLVTPEDLRIARKRIGPYKACADNLIPHTIIHNDNNLLWHAIRLTTILTKQHPDQISFQSRLMIFKKVKTQPIALSDSIRLITITTLDQKTLEHLAKPWCDDLSLLLGAGQVGFMSGKETSMHVIRALHRLYHRKQDKYKFSCLYFVDIVTAFDSVPHNRLLAKLKLMGAKDDLLNFIAWYLNQLGVNIGKFRIPINRGAPQGGVLSPFLWLCYMDDLIKIIQKSVSDPRDVMCYADDLLVILDNITFVNRISTLVEEWAVLNEVKINYNKKKNDKTAILIVQHQKNFILDTYELALDIPIQPQYKYLGVIINQNMDFDMDRIDKAIQKSWVIRFQKISTRKKVILFQSYFLGKFRFLLLALQFYPEKQLLKRLNQKVLQLLRIVLGLSSKSSSKRLLAQEMIKGTLDQLVSTANNRVLYKLQQWDNQHYKDLNGHTPINWLQYTTKPRNYDYMRGWEGDQHDDSMWFKLALENTFWYSCNYCTHCNFRVINRQHRYICLLFKDFLYNSFIRLLMESKNELCIQKYEKDISPTFNQFLLMFDNPHIINIFYDRSKKDSFVKPFQTNKERQLFKEKFASHVTMIKDFWQFQYSPNEQNSQQNNQDDSDNDDDDPQNSRKEAKKQRKLKNLLKKQKKDATQLKDKIKREVNSITQTNRIITIVRPINNANANSQPNILNSNLQAPLRKRQGRPPKVQHLIVNQQDHYNEDYPQDPRSLHFLFDLQDQLLSEQLDIHSHISDAMSQDLAHSQNIQNLSDFQSQPLNLNLQANMDWPDLSSLDRDSSQLDLPLVVSQEILPPLEVIENDLNDLD